MKRELRNPRKYQGGFVQFIGLALTAYAANRAAKKAKEERAAIEAQQRADTAAAETRVAEEKRVADLTAQQQRRAFESLSAPASLSALGGTAPVASSGGLSPQTLLIVAGGMIGLVIVTRLLK